MQFHLIKERIRLSTSGNSQSLDVTPDLASLIKKNRVVDGHALVFVPGSTAGVTTIEYEPGLLKDLPEAFERVASSTSRYHHNEAWGDGNGHSHVRAALIGPSLMIPIEDGELTLGTWQQVVLIDFDNRPRQRRLVVQLFGTIES